MVPTAAESPITIFVGLGIVILGYLIKHRKWTFLIAGYDSSSSVPKQVAADIVGNLALRIGIATALFGVLAVVVSIPDLIGIAFAAAVILAVLLAIYRLQTFQTQIPEADDRRSQ